MMLSLYLDNGKIRIAHSLNRVIGAIMKFNLPAAKFESQPIPNVPSYEQSLEIGSVTPPTGFRISCEGGGVWLENDQDEVRPVCIEINGSSVTLEVCKGKTFIGMLAYYHPHC